MLVCTDSSSADECKSSTPPPPAPPNSATGLGALGRVLTPVEPECPVTLDDTTPPPPPRLRKRRVPPRQRARAVLTGRLSAPLCVAAAVPPSTAAAGTSTVVGGDAVAAGCAALAAAQRRAEVAAAARSAGTSTEVGGKAVAAALAAAQRSVAAASTQATTAAVESRAAGTGEDPRVAALEARLREGEEECARLTDMLCCAEDALAQWTVRWDERDWRDGERERLSKVRRLAHHAASQTCGPDVHDAAAQAGGAPPAAADAGAQCEAAPARDAAVLAAPCVAEASTDPVVPATADTAAQVCPAPVVLEGAAGAPLPVTRVPEAGEAATNTEAPPVCVERGVDAGAGEVLRASESAICIGRRPPATKECETQLDERREAHFAPKWGEAGSQAEAAAQESRGTGMSRKAQEKMGWTRSVGCQKYASSSVPTTSVAHAACQASEFVPPSPPHGGRRAWPDLEPVERSVMPSEVLVECMQNVVSSIGRLALQQRRGAPPVVLAEAAGRDVRALQTMVATHVGAQYELYFPHLPPGPPMPE